MQVKKHPKRLTTLFLSTLILLTYAPAAFASEEHSADDLTFTDLEKQDIQEETVEEEQEPEAETEMETMVLSVVNEEAVMEDAASVIPEETETIQAEETEDVEASQDLIEEAVPEEPAEQEVSENPVEENSSGESAEANESVDAEDPIDDEEPTPEPLPEEPEVPEEVVEVPEEPDLPADEEGLPDTTIDPVLKPNPIEPNASTISGIANPGAHVIVVYPGTDKQRATTVNPEGDWLIRNVGGDSVYLTEGSLVPMDLQVHDNDQIYTYSYLFEVGDSTATDLIEASQVVYVPNNVETTSGQAASTAPIEAPTEVPTEAPAENQASASNSSLEEQELLPPTGEAESYDLLAAVSLASGAGLLTMTKKKRRQA